MRWSRACTNWPPRRGILACPEGAATLIGLKRLVADGVIESDEVGGLVEHGVRV